MSEIASEISWTVLGSSSGIPSPTRNCSGHLLKFSDSLTLFDCGSGVTKAFLQRSFEPDCLEHIFISHTHSDHISDLPLLVQLLYNLKRNKPLYLYLPQEAITSFASFLSACYLFREKFSFDLRLRPIKEIQSPGNGNISVRAILNNHLSKAAAQIKEFDYPNRMESYSFLITLQDRVRVLYSADIGSLVDITPYLGALDFLVLETFHIDLGQLEQSLQANPVKRVLLTHYTDQDREKLENYIARSLHRQCLSLAEDGMTVNLGTADIALT